MKSNQMKTKSVEYQQKTMNLSSFAYYGFILISVCVSMYLYVPLFLKNYRLSRSHTQEEIDPKDSSILNEFQVPIFLQPNPDCSNLLKAKDDIHYHVTQAMNNAYTMKQENMVFMMLNGENHGVYVQWDQQKSNCLHELAVVGLEILRVDKRLVPNGLRMVTQYGEYVTTSEELEAKAHRIVHILLDSQIWIWPGIEVGYEYQVDQMILRTISLRPLVYIVENFASDQEALSIVEIGKQNLTRAELDFSTNTEYWFPKGHHISNIFRYRTARLARLPSPSNAETFRLNRYDPNEYNAVHSDYLHYQSNNQFYPLNGQAQEFLKWNKWIQNRMEQLLEYYPFLKYQLPSKFLPGNSLYPNYYNRIHFQKALLELYLTKFYTKQLIFPDYVLRINEMILLHIEGDYGALLEFLSNLKTSFWLEVVRVWEHELGTKFPFFIYKFRKDKVPVLGTSHYFRWIRWCQEEIHRHKSNLPSHILPGKMLYPSYYLNFSRRMFEIILNDYSDSVIISQSQIDQETLDWIKTKTEDGHAMEWVLKTYPKFFDFVPVTWERHATTTLIQYKIPAYVEHFYPQRFVTLVLSLTNVEEGGETVFPFSNETYGPPIHRKGMPECSFGLAIPPKKLRGLLFYSQTANHEEDIISRHGGCPPVKGTKQNINMFTWNVNSDEAQSIRDMEGDSTYNAKNT